MEFENKQWKQVMAIVPMYEENGGNFSEVWLEDGRHVVMPYTVETTVERLARVFAIDIARLRINCQKASGRTRLIPLPLHRHLWLTPLYMRTKPRVAGDGVVGYVIYQHVVSCQPNAQDGKKTDIVFDNQEKLTISQKSETANQVILLTHTLGQYQKKR